MKLSNATILKLVNVITLLSFFLPFVTFCSIQKKEIEETAIVDSTAIETESYPDSSTIDSTSFVNRSDNSESITADSSQKTIENNSILEAIWETMIAQKYGDNICITGFGLTMSVVSALDKASLLPDGAYPLLSL